MWWKQFFDVQRPYRWHIRKLKPGFVLDIGCGIGRNLIHLNGVGIGIDHNPASIETAKNNGLCCFTNSDFIHSDYYKENYFDSIVFSHVAEHMTDREVVDLLIQYIPLLKKKGKLIIITPQETGYKADPTHVQFIDFKAARRIVEAIHLKVVMKYSFPLPRFMGNFFKYNEFVIIAQKD